MCYTVVQPDAGGQMTILALLGVLIALLYSLIGNSSALAQKNPPYIRDVRIFDPDFPLPNAAGLAFSPQANAFLVLAEHSPTQPGGGSANLQMISPFEDLLGATNLPPMSSPIKQRHLGNRVGRAGWSTQL